MTTLAERFTQAMSEAKEKRPYLSKSGLAKHCGVRPSTVTDWFNGTTKTLNGECAVKAASYFDVSSIWLMSGEGSMHAESIGLILDDVSMEGEGLIGIPEYRISFACGTDPGEPTFEEITESEKAWYRPEWFQKRQINPDNCKRFKVRGTSMEPMIWDRDTILVDCTPHDIIDGKIYAFCISGQMRVKFLFTKLDGSMLVRSFNPDVADEVIPPNDMDTFRLIGRVRDRSGGSFF